MWPVAIVGVERVWECVGALELVRVAVGVGPAFEQRADEALDSPMSSVECWRGFGPGEEAAVDDVGEVSFERAAGFAWCLALRDLAGEEGAGWWVVAGLDDRDPVEGGVELAVAAAVEPVVSVAQPGSSSSAGATSFVRASSSCSSSLIVRLS